MGEGTGRNEPCHCGSGRKYKHCHGGVGPEDDQIKAAVQHNRHNVNKALGLPPDKKPVQGQNPFFNEIWDAVGDERCEHLERVPVQPWLLTMPFMKWCCKSCTVKRTEEMKGKNLGPVEENTCDRCRTYIPPIDNELALHLIVIRQDMWTVVGAVCDDCHDAMMNEPGAELVEVG